MIFQAPIDLDLPDRTVQAIIDLDTGCIGFTEFLDGQTIEYFYNESPLEFKTALFKQLNPLYSHKSLGNFKVCRKSEQMQTVNTILRSEIKR